MKKLITKEDFTKIAHEVCDVNHNLQRWSNFPFAQECGYNELAKQSLNMIATFLLLQQAKEQGVEIDETRIPLIAIKRLIEKTINGDIRDDHINQTLKQGEIKREVFNVSLNTKITNIHGLSDLLGTVHEDWPETKIYKIATKMATLVEVNEFSFIPGSKEVEGEIQASLTKYCDDFPQLVATALNPMDQGFLLLMEISKLRASIRWAKMHKATKCSVLEHLGETAVFAWLMSLEQNHKDFERATRMFWAGLFHDIAERWTGDMDSKLKDSVPGLREATERLEELMLEQHVYNALPLYQAKALKNVLRAREKPTAKGADYLSATLECYRNINCGSRDKSFWEVIEKYFHNQDERFTLLARELINEIWNEISLIN